MMVLNQGRAGNYFCTKHTLRLNLWPRGQISAKKGTSMKLGLAGRMWPTGRALPALALDDINKYEPVFERNLTVYFCA